MRPFEAAVSLIFGRISLVFGMIVFHLVSLKYPFGIVEVPFSMIYVFLVRNNYLPRKIGERTTHDTTARRQTSISSMKAICPD